MTCRKVRKLMPLAAGGDLGPRLDRAFRAHLGACPGCRNEFESLSAALGAFRRAANEERVPDWAEGEWQALMVRATAGWREEREAKEGASRPAAWPRWAAASALGLLMGLVVLSVLFRTPGLGPGRTAAKAAVTSEAAGSQKQDIVSVTMVSQETGLQVVWFFDKTFNSEGVKK